jgi:hypothetical protein
MTIRSRIVRKAAVTLVAVAALLAQAFFPHVHAWHLRSGSQTAVARADADQHSPSTCPLCRAQTDARSSLLAPAFVVALPASTPATLAAAAASSVTTVAWTVAAPRAPPLAY